MILYMDMQIPILIYISYFDNTNTIIANKGKDLHNLISKLQFYECFTSISLSKQILIS